MSNAPLVQEGLSKTMFERVVELYDKNGGKHAISRMLKVQYRMHASIADWASQALYGGELQTHKSVEARTLGQLLLLDGATTRTSTTADLSRQQQQEGLEDESPLLLIDTAGCNMYESENAAGSRFNEGEAQIVVQHVRKLMAMGVQQDQIAVISPYNGQVEVLRLALLPEAPKLQIRSVDGFQGGEREAVVLSLVRSSECGGKQGIGFLRDDRRLNVAVTRAKRHCCVICDSETVSQSPFVKNLIQWMEEHGEQRSALEVLDQIDSVDLAQAELDLERLLQGAFKPSASVKKSSNRQQAPLDMEHRRHALLEKIRAFQSNAKQGDEMVMSAELSKLDRKLVHEIAEELGLGHLSEGVEGVNRKIKIIILPNNDLLAITPASTLPSATARSGSALMEESERSNTHGAVAGPGETPAQGEELDDDFEEIPENFVQQPTASVYAAFEVDEEDNGPSASEKVAEKPALNSVLANLTKERAERQKERDALQQDIAKKSKKKKGQKLGGGTKKLPASALNGVDYNAELDDLTFLNAQIDKVQNSHGRQVEGRGKSYRTIINGVLLAKPMSSSLTEKKKGVQASASLNNKLKEALDSRKAKPKKK